MLGYYKNEEAMNSLLFIFKDNALVSFGFYHYADFKKEVDFKTIVLRLPDSINFKFYKRITEDIKTKANLQKFIADAYLEYYLIEKDKCDPNFEKVCCLEYFNTNGYSIVSVDPDLFEMHYKTIIKNEINEKQKTLLK